MCFLSYLLSLPIRPRVTNTVRWQGVFGCVLVPGLEKSEMFFGDDRGVRVGS